MTNKSMILDDFCIDMLKEVGHICTGNAAVALSQVINHKVELEIPDLKLISSSKIFEFLKNSQEVLVGVSIQLWGKLTGNIVLMFPEKSAYSLIDVITNYDSPVANATEYGVSSLKEIGNIVISAYLGTLSTFTKTIILHSTPSLVCGTLDTVFSVAFGRIEEQAKQVILIETFFSIKDMNIKGSFFLMFEPVAVKSLLEEAKIYKQKESK